MSKRILCELKFLKATEKPRIFTSAYSAWVYINVNLFNIPFNELSASSKIPLSKLYSSLRSPLGYLDFGMDNTTNPSSWKYRIKSLKP